MSKPSPIQDDRHNRPIHDAWLLVTVVDASGKAISNNVPVTLTITSGPGEFPTGTSITFTPPGSGAASDIAILDGQAAIEFRTYYSGTSVITATSTGLTSASVSLTSQGNPAYVAGQTPATPARPYTRQARLRYLAVRVLWDCCPTRAGPNR